MRFSLRTRPASQLSLAEIIERVDEGVYSLIYGHSSLTEVHRDTIDEMNDQPLETLAAKRGHSYQKFERGHEVLHLPPVAGLNVTVHGCHGCNISRYLGMRACFSTLQFEQAELQGHAEELVRDFLAYAEEDDVDVALQARLRGSTTQSLLRYLRECQDCGSGDEEAESNGARYVVQ